MNAINTAVQSSVNTVEQLTQLQTQSNVAAQNASANDVDSTLNRLQDTRDAINITGRDGDNSLKSISVDMAKMDVSLSQTELIVYDGELSSANIELQSVRAQLATKRAELAAEEARVAAAAAAAAAAAQEAARVAASQNEKFTDKYQSEFINVWDQDKDGSLSTKEMTDPGWWKAEDWNKHVARHDDTGDGKLNFNELLSVWREFDDNTNGALDGQYGANAQTTTGELGTYWRGDYSNQPQNSSATIVDNTGSIRLEISQLENKEEDHQANIAKLTPLRAAAEANLEAANADLAKYESMDDTEFKDDSITRKGIEQKSLDLTRRANNLGSFMAGSNLVQTDDFNELELSQKDMKRDEVAADRRWRMNEIDYDDKGLEHSDIRNDKTHGLISKLVRLAELSSFEEKSIQGDSLS